MLLTRIATLNALLASYAGRIGGDAVAYRNHTYRVANLCVALSSVQGDAVEKIAIAAAFHDIGIWTDDTFDYIEPSVREATAYLAQSGRADWSAEVGEMIRQHHKISSWGSDPRGLVEAFRRADWIDVSFGLRRFGVQRALLRQLSAEWPDAGFHRMLLRLELKQLRTHPLNPLPMVKL